MPTRRQERVNKRIIQELVTALGSLKNVDLGFVTLTKCEVTSDLRHAKVFVSVWGGDDVQDRTLDLLRQNASRLKGMIGRPLGTKVVPNVHFEIDKTIANAAEMSLLIRDARATDMDPTPLTPEQAEALIAQGAAGSAGHGAEEAAARDADVFEAARMDVEEELFGDDDDGDGGDEWKPINLDELPKD